MKSLRPLVLLLLVGHAVISVITLRESGVWGALPPFPNLPTYQVFSDLGVALLLVHALLYVELRRTGQSLKPLVACFVAMPFVGSFAPLALLLLKPDLLALAPQND